MKKKKQIKQALKLIKKLTGQVEQQRDRLEDINGKVNGVTYRIAEAEARGWKAIR